MKKKELLKRIELLEKRFATEEEKSLLEPKKELEVGKWYLLNTNNVFGDKSKLKNALIYNNGKSESYAFNWVGEFNNNFHIARNFDNLIREATPQEVEEALIKEAKRRGYKKGCYVKSFVYGTTPIEYSEIHYRLDSNTLVMGGAWIFKDGEWADVIKNDDKPQSGDVCKFWNNWSNQGNACVGFLDVATNDGKYVCNGNVYTDCKKLTQQEVIDLLFKK